MTEGDQVGGERAPPGAMAVELRRQEGQQQWLFLPRTTRTGQATEVFRGEWWPGILVNSEYLPALLSDLGDVAGVLGVSSPLKRMAASEISRLHTHQGPLVDLCLLIWVQGRLKGSQASPFQSQLNHTPYLAFSIALRAFPPFDTPFFKITKWKHNNMMIKFYLFYRTMFYSKLQ